MHAPPWIRAARSSRAAGLGRPAHATAELERYLPHSIGGRVSLALLEELIATAALVGRPG